MNKLIYIKYLWLMLPLLAVFGCNDNEFLTEKPKTFYTTSNAFSSSDQVDQVIVGCYSYVRYMYNLVGQNDPWLAFKGANGTDLIDVPTIRRANRFNDYGIITPTHTVFNTVYTAFYQLVERANLAIYAADLPQIIWSSQADKTYALAQARFFRAFAYRNLGELFGGVPIVKEIVTSPRYDFERTTRVQTYQFAIDELEAILNDLPVTTSLKGRLTKGAAQHLLCQLYLDKGLANEADGTDPKAAYQKAIDNGNAVIDGGTYSLMTSRFGSRATQNPDYYFANTTATQTADRLYSKAGYPITANVYWDLFQEGNQDYQAGNKEAIWSTQVNYTAYKTEDKESFLPYSRVFGGVFRDPASAIATGTLEDVGGRGIAQAIPNFYTRDIIYADKWGTDMRNSEAVFRRIFLGNVSTNTTYYGKVIPWSVLYKDGQTKDAIDAAKTQIYPVSCKIATDKYTGVADGENMSNLFRGEYIFRLSETILLRAEAKMRMNDLSGAANDINIVRRRATCSYLVTPSDVNVDLILDERARELVYEETRWNTLLRMGGTIAIDRIKKYSYWDDPRNTLTSKFNLWPIPQLVIDTNKDKPMAQNPGW
ncbi:MAG: RagB/SusD family nutrient uptake outer membrane protein [Prolixibacteraceae bacterium]